MRYLIDTLYIKMNGRLLMIITSIFLMSCGHIISKIIPFQNLPSPTGNFSVGTQIMTWEDSSRKEWFTENPDDYRKIVIQVWYPAIDVFGDPSPYIDNWRERIGPISEQINVSKMLITSIKDVQSNSYLNAKLYTSDKKFPLIIFSHGLGGMRMQNTIQMETLASEGYLVVAIDHAYDANITLFEDGSAANFRSGAEGDLTVQEFWDLRIPQLNTRSEDVIFLLDEIELLIEMGDLFWRSINMDHIGIMGHSFGGATAIISSAKDDRLDACIALDGWIVPIESSYIQSGMKVPLLYIGRPEWETTVNYDKLDSLIVNSNVPSVKLILPGTKHFDYSDTPQFSSLARNVGVSGKMSSDALRDTLTTRMLNLFNEYLMDY